LGKQYRSFSCSLCNFLHSPVTSSLVHIYVYLSLYSVLNLLWEISGRILTLMSHRDQLSSKENDSQNNNNLLCIFCTHK
jgi:hypothetical protein